jgi:hypothetical protein
MNLFFKLSLIFFLSQPFLLIRSQSFINPETHTVRIQDDKTNLVLNVNYDRKCVIDNIEVLGRRVSAKDDGASSFAKINGNWFTTRAGIPQPTVSTEREKIIIGNIQFGGKENLITEKWIFQTFSDYIEWTIERIYDRNMTLEDTGFPQWTFDSMETWTGALLGTGGVAWCKLFDKPNASYGNHTGVVTFWNNMNKSCLKIDPVKVNGKHLAVRFSRQPDNNLTLNYTASEEKVRTRHFLSRFIIDRQDIWDSFDARDTTSVTYRLKASNYDTTFYRGEFPGIKGESVRNVLNTIARVGVIDENLMGSNNWHIDMGYVCLHEQWIAEMGLAINDPDYLDNYSKALDYYRDNAVSEQGNVKDRWGYRIWDSKPGTFDNGFYECFWGDLLDANTDYVTNVAQLFQLNGNIDWVKSHKLQCEKVLGYLLGRDSDNDGLVEVMTDSYKEKKGSDWIDVIWASWENAFINAKLYEAMKQWSEAEEILGDTAMADYYRKSCAKCKARFNQPVTEGGFWSTQNQWYVYWRDKDDTVHGDNLVTPVNFMAIAYGICDDNERKKAILSKTEMLMQKEKLFMWPISFLPYKADEGYKVNYPFPRYENGDIFLGWAETGIRAYSDFDPSISLKYIKNVLDKYDKDGLAFQRYDRLKQEGQGNDILAGNCLAVVGLYRDVYGIQPQYNRLFIEPHMTEELNGTNIKYRFRDKDYTIQLYTDHQLLKTDSFTISSAGSFGMNTEDNMVSYFNRNNQLPSLIISCNKNPQLQISIEQWDNNPRAPKKWKVRSASGESYTNFEIPLLKAVCNYSVSRNGKHWADLKSDRNGQIQFSCKIETGKELIFELHCIE